jgi:hypothetical protein
MDEMYSLEKGIAFAQKSMYRVTCKIAVPVPGLIVPILG